MKETIFTIQNNTPLTESVYKMILSGDTSEITRSGQFVNLKIDGLFLRRPISVCNLEDGLLTIIYKVVGRGTEEMSKMGLGTKLNILTGLGNGYDTSISGNKPLLIGGGVGIPPLYYLARKLKEEGKDVKVILGFNTKSELFLEDEFTELGIETIVATTDGSYQNKGVATDVLPEEYSYVYTCGPEAMLKAVFHKIQTSGQFSFEERMGCGFGACMGCSCKTITGYKRICKDGPVLQKEEILWED